LAAGKIHRFLGLHTSTIKHSPLSTSWMRNKRSMCSTQILPQSFATRTLRIEGTFQGCWVLLELERCMSIKAKCKRHFADQLLSKITHISHSTLINSVINTPHYKAPIKKRDKTIIDPDSPPSLEIRPIGFKEKATRQLGGDHKPSTRTNTKR
jgi:hypothetical protein